MGRIFEIFDDDHGDLHLVCWLCTWQLTVERTGMTFSQACDLALHVREHQVAAAMKD